MASVQTDVNEKIFNISRWLGVNEACEGQARLERGEAAVMRNFQVTAGGALRKRPGSRDVAGLLSRYVPEVVPDSEKRLFTTRGDAGTIEVFPRMDVDTVGGVHPQGESAEITPESAGEHTGWFLERDGGTFELARCVTHEAEGAEKITGGAADVGELALIASGALETRDGERVTHGETAVTAYDEAFVTDEGAGARGAETKHDFPEDGGAGWTSENVGGYIMHGGRLWRYYGAKTESAGDVWSWKKYRCMRSSYTYSYYTQSGWGAESLYSTLTGGARQYGFPSVTFDSSTGNFRQNGSRLHIDAGGSGTVYYAEGNVARKIVVRRESASKSVAYTSLNRGQGPYWAENVSYSRGEYVGDVAVAPDRRPDEDAGYSYVTSFSYGGAAYTVMSRGGEYFCYVRDTERGALGSVREWGFYGYPLTARPSSFDWYFRATRSRPNETSDTEVRGLWSGYVAGREVLCAAAGGYLWELENKDGAWSKTACGSVDTTRDVHMFGFDGKLYLLNGAEYLVWDGRTLGAVEGYRPLVSVAAPPEGGGTLLEGVNRLTGGRRCRFSPDGSATEFKLPEDKIESVDYVKNLVTGEELRDYTAELERGAVRFTSPPARGIDTIEIGWSAKSAQRDEVLAMRFAELYNGAQDTRVFIYGDGTNRAFYSGLDYEGRARADYFPDMYELAVGDSNTPVTAMIRHYNKLIVFKPSSAWSVGYDTLTLADGTVTAGFYVTPVNRSIGCCAYGQARLVMNRPRTLDGRSVIEWRASGSGTLTGDERNAERVSQKVDGTIRSFDLERARTFYDKFSHEYYVIGEDGTALVENMDSESWYVYTGLELTTLVNYRDELYFGTKEGALRHFSTEYLSDNGEAIDAYWESGAMSFGEDWRRKYSAMLWVGIKPEEAGYLEVTAETDKKSDFAVFAIEKNDGNSVPEMARVKLRAKKFTYYKLILQNRTADRTATVVSASLRVRSTGFVR